MNLRLVERHRCRDDSDSEPADQPARNHRPSCRGTATRGLQKGAEADYCCSTESCIATSKPVAYWVGDEDVASESADVIDTSNSAPDGKAWVSESIPPTRVDKY